MALKDYQINNFRGIDQYRSENVLEAGYSPDAANMDTENGDLAVAKGYVKHFQAEVPGTGRIRRMFRWRTTAGEKFIVIAGSSIYCHVPVEGDTPESWETVYTYAEEITTNDWDFEEIRIGNVDHLIVANGQTQMIKWNGTDPAALFGSGEYVYESTIAALTYNAQKADEVVASTAGTTLTYTLTMPAGWAYAVNEEVAFDVAANIDEAITAVNIAIAGSSYTLDYVPAWTHGEMAVVQLTGAAAAEVSDTVYGVTGATLATAISADWKQRALDVGIQLKGVTYPVSAVSEDRLTVTLSKAATEALAAGDTAKVRGGVSDLPVNFIEIHYSRLFAAGDPDHPSRLYWSQPPGDVRTIEDWSADDASDLTSGGHVEIGNTSNDPITGLRSLSSQLLIYKESSLYRLLGDRPSNFRIAPVNKDTETMCNTASVTHGDVPYWLTRAGMYYHDGQNAHLSPKAKQIRKILADADVSHCKAVECRDRLYFTCRRGDGDYDDSIIVFDMSEGTYMLRNGFKVVDLCAHNGTLYMINDSRYVYRFGEGSSYDGEPIDAHWRTPMTDLQEKSVLKELRNMFLRGSGDRVKIMLTIDTNVQGDDYFPPLDEATVKRVPLKNSGRAFYMTISNVAGSWFRLRGGIEIIMNLRRDDIYG